MGKKASQNNIMYILWEYAGAEKGLEGLPSSWREWLHMTGNGRAEGGFTRNSLCIELFIHLRNQKLVFRR